MRAWRKSGTNIYSRIKICIRKEGDVNIKGLLKVNVRCNIELITTCMRERRNNRRIINQQYGKNMENIW